MGFMNDVDDALSSGFGAAERAGQSLKIQGDIKRLELRLDKWYAKLGRAVYADSRLQGYLEQAHYAEYSKIKDVLEETAAFQKRLDELKQAPVRPAQPVQQGVGKQYACPVCGSPVLLTNSYCTNCGDNLANLKEGRRLCPSCQTLYTQEAVFCPSCGVRTIELTIAPAIDTSLKDIPNPAVYSRQEDASSEETATTVVDEETAGPKAENTSEDSPELVDAEGCDETQVENADVLSNVSSDPEVTTCCPACGASLDGDPAFCHDCGASLK